MRVCTSIYVHPYMHMKKEEEEEVEREGVEGEDGGKENDEDEEEEEEREDIACVMTRKPCINVFYNQRHAVEQKEKGKLFYLVK